MEYAHKTKEIKVGRYYLVAHAVMVKEDWVVPKVYVPIIPIKHEDKEFAPKVPLHYHIDGRFNVSATVKDVWNIFNGKTNNVVVEEELFGSYSLTEIIYKKKKCVRLTTGIIAPFGFKPFDDWRKGQVGKSCAGRVCPHYKAKMNLIDGELVCPMHGLKGDPVTETII